MRIPRIYIWLALIAVVAGLCLPFLQVSYPEVVKWKHLLMGGGCVILLFVLSQFLMTHVGQEIPRSAVLEILDRCKKERRQWVLVYFKPQVPLNEAQKRLGKSYSQDAREKGFMFKLSNVHASQPDIVVFYSKKKGLLCGNAQAIRFLLEKYGRFMMNNWRCLLGAMLKNGLRAQSLDGGQVFSSGGEYMGSVEDD